MDIPYRNFVHVSLWLFLITFTNFCFSQSSSSDSTNQGVLHAIRIYTRAMGDQAGFYNGIQYKRYPHVIHSGQPFFIADSLMKGTLTYDGILYENVNLMYDEVRDELITSDVQGDNLVQLYKEKVSRFSIGTNEFIHLSQSFPSNGYYRLLYNGKSQLIAREYKSIQVKTDRNIAETERSVYSTTDYYLKTETGYVKFNRLRSFLSLLGNERKAVEQFIKDRKLRFGNDPENLLYQAIIYYDQLTDK